MVHLPQCFPLFKGSLAGEKGINCEIIFWLLEEGSLEGDGLQGDTQHGDEAEESDRFLSFSRLSLHA